MNISKKLLPALLGVFLLATPGCMWSRVKVNDPGIVARSHAVKVGVTRENDLEKLLLAKPTMRIQGKDTHTLAYTFSDTKSNGLMLILFNFTRSTTVAETLYIDVDSATGKVRKVHRPRIPEVEWRFWPFSDR